MTINRAWADPGYEVTAANLMHPMRIAPNFWDWFGYHAQGMSDLFESPLKVNKGSHVGYVTGLAVVPREIPFNEIERLVLEQVQGALEFEARKNNAALLTVPRYWLFRSDYRVGDCVNIVGASITMPRLVIS